MFKLLLITTLIRMVQQSPMPKLAFDVKKIGLDFLKFGIR
jgi:hypothetical protein